MLVHEQQGQEKQSEARVFFIVLRALPRAFPPFPVGTRGGSTSCEVAQEGS